MAAVNGDNPRIQVRVRRDDIKSPVPATAPAAPSSGAFLANY